MGPSLGDCGGVIPMDRTMPSAALSAVARKLPNKSTICCNGSLLGSGLNVSWVTCSLFPSLLRSKRPNSSFCTVVGFRLRFDRTFIKAAACLSSLFHGSSSNLMHLKHSFGYCGRGNKFAGQCTCMFCCAFLRATCRTGRVCCAAAFLIAGGQTLPVPSSPLAL